MLQGDALWLGMAEPERPPPPSLRAQRGNPGRQALAMVAGRSGLPRRCAPRNDGGGAQLPNPTGFPTGQGFWYGLRHGTEESEWRPARAPSSS